MPGQDSANVEQSDKGLDPVLEKELEAVRSMSRNLVVTRLARTNILQLDYTSADAINAAKIANAYADAYVDLELNRRTDSMPQHAQTWLQTRSEELRRQSAEADAVAQKSQGQSTTCCQQTASCSLSSN